MKTALGIIDAQRGFMPTEEGLRLGVPGFGELPITGAELDIPNINKLAAAADLARITIFTTQDWHPRETAHFAEEPNFDTTWPVHCVANTPGAEFHPEFKVPVSATRFYKGNERLERGEDDQSYSGMNGYAFENNQPLPDWLDEREVDELIIAGEALTHCLKMTALDGVKRGMKVIVASDATTPVMPEMARATIEELDAAGVKFATTAELLKRIAETAK